jgi:pyridinium-3,5-biscarboxylic acid mononucleotide sulfurtransferase
MSSVATTSIDQIATNLIETIRSYHSAIVALSAGVDSAVVTQAAFLALGEQAIAVTASSASLATGELDEARDLARQIGIKHRIVMTNEFQQPAYLRNDTQRCYHCKTELYTQLETLRQELGVATILNGANLDDLGDYRPGMQAASEHAVLSPLVECGINKATVRRLAQHWQLPCWDKPATPCLSSRVAYGEQVTPERLQLIDSAEQWLRGQGFPIVRVRYHTGDLARVEVPHEQLERLLAQPLRQELERELKRLGFRFVTVDLSGFQSGSMNQLLPILN